MNQDSGEPTPSLDMKWLDLRNNQSKVRDDLKLPDDNEEAPKINGLVGDLISGCETFSLLDARTSQVVKSTYCVPKKKERKKKKQMVKVLEFRLITDHF